MKKAYFVILLTLTLAPIFGQTAASDNTITIDGNVYYFRPSKTPSSPLPKIGDANFINYGMWYGEEAAKAWSIVSDWASKHCDDSTNPIIPWRGQNIYISSMEAKAGNFYRHEIIINYWIVNPGQKMEEGYGVVRNFYF
ncbi:MAG: hypothetical protein LBC27_07090 [Spirochaetaceae bacterium]|jgi:hypothetical protein|nr:hypothetical protein [Spirochaetaceae bacterium]